jgi:two-component system copper resistance phosphate regulon response regulator CusR
MALLLVEDEPRVADFVSRGLTEEGFAVRIIGNGSEALAQLGLESFELVLVDWLLPGKTGLQLVQGLRARGDITPVMMLTARDDVQDRVAALNAGADDYLTKPFAFAELLARVRALVRRSHGRARGPLRVADLVLDPSGRRVERAGQVIKLTAREFSLLQFLMEHEGQVMTRAQIVAAVWEHDAETFSNVVDVYIRYLRTKIDEPFELKLIHTVRMAGYVVRSRP